MKIGDRVYVHGYVDEIRKETIIIRNEGGYFGTVPEEVVEIGKVLGDFCNRVKKYMGAERRTE